MIDSFPGTRGSFAKKIRLETRELGRGEAGKAERDVTECATRNNLEHGRFYEGSQVTD
ncbi:MAG TPA: hypothetical protein VK487_04420 [Candidatus Bathyarchaeia archaeon]|nr:hypothetical protein [Candidatus Bathyarchaeia archaeon]